MNHLTKDRRHPSGTPTTRRFASALLIGALMLGSSACASGQSGASAVALPAFVAAAGTAPLSTDTAPQSTATTSLSTETAQTDPAAPPVEPAVPAAPGADVNACSLLKAAEVKKAIGTNSGPEGSGNECVWTNQDNQYSVTVHVGSTGTAVNGTLPDPLPGETTEAGPDGIRFGAAQTADFVIGDRACYVQLATLSDDFDQAELVKLVGIVRGRVKS